MSKPNKTHGQNNHEQHDHDHKNNGLQHTLRAHCNLPNTFFLQLLPKCPYLFVQILPFHILNKLFFHFKISKIFFFFVVVVVGKVKQQHRLASQASPVNPSSQWQMRVCWSHFPRNEHPSGHLYSPVVFVFVCVFFVCWSAWKGVRSVIPQFVCLCWFKGFCF